MRLLRRAKPQHSVRFFFLPKHGRTNPNIRNFRGERQNVISLSANNAQAMWYCVGFDEKFTYLWKKKTVFDLIVYRVQSRWRILIEQRQCSSKTKAERVHVFFSKFKLTECFQYQQLRNKSKLKFSAYRLRYKSSQYNHLFNLGQFNLFEKKKENHHFMRFYFC